MDSKIATFFLLFLCLRPLLIAEVEEIILRWNAITCYEICVPRLEENLRAIKAVRHLQMNGRSGVATMGWDPNHPFSYPPFQFASAAAGVKLLDIRLRVRGQIIQDANHYYLTSIGDGERFWIIGPLIVEPGRYTSRNVESHPLPTLMKLRLSAAEEEGQTVVIVGPLLFPFYKYPRTLIAEQIEVPEEQHMDPRYKR